MTDLLLDPHPVFRASPHLLARLDAISGESTTARWWRKANALALALPTAHASGIACLLAVAQSETRCGDAWAGEHNWGATVRRALHTDELKALADNGVHASVGADHLAVEAKARAVLQAAVAAGNVLDPGPSVALHCDSTAEHGAYFIWFAAFATDEEGAKYFATFFRTGAEHDAIDAGSPNNLARAMYAAGYYTGFHLRVRTYQEVAGKWVLLPAGETATGPTESGAELNIADYTRGMLRFFPDISRALVGWTPGATNPPEPEPALGAMTTLEVQHALNLLGADPKLVEDGVAGPATKRSIVAFQSTHGLTPDGIAGPKTSNSIRVALANR